MNRTVSRFGEDVHVATFLYHFPKPKPLRLASPSLLLAPARLIQHLEAGLLAAQLARTPLPRNRKTPRQEKNWYGQVKKMLM